MLLHEQPILFILQNYFLKSSLKKLDGDGDLFPNPPSSSIYVNDWRKSSVRKRLIPFTVIINIDITYYEYDCVVNMCVSRLFAVNRRKRTF